MSIIKMSTVSDDGRYIGSGTDISNLVGGGEQMQDSNELYPPQQQPMMEQYQQQPMMQQQPPMMQQQQYQQPMMEHHKGHIPMYTDSKCQPEVRQYYEDSYDSRSQYEVNMVHIVIMIILFIILASPTVISLERSILPRFMYNVNCPS